jgi:hypothetical protein
MKNNDYLDWLYLMGMHDTIEIIDEVRFAFYNSISRVLDINAIIINEI